jgi:hypothetical protein
LLEGKKAIWFWYYKNGDYEYEEKNGYLRLVKNGKDVLDDCRYYKKGHYKDE